MKDILNEETVGIGSIILLIIAVIFIAAISSAETERKFEKYFDDYDIFYVQGIEYKTDDVISIKAESRTYDSDKIQIEMKNGKLIFTSEDAISFKKKDD